MPGVLDALKAILEGIPGGFTEPWYGVRPGKDKILRDLTPDEIKDHEEVCMLESELRASLRRSLRCIRLFESKRYLLLDKIRVSDERADSAEAREKVLGFRKTMEGTHVLVESSIEDLE
jgi:hypothetical protein